MDKNQKRREIIKQERREIIKQAQQLFVPAFETMPVQKKLGMDEVTFNMNKLIQDGLRWQDFAHLVEGCGFDNFAFKKAEGQVTLTISGYESLNMLADMGVDFPGSSNYKSPGLKK